VGARRWSSLPSGISTFSISRTTGERQTPPAGAEAVRDLALELRDVYFHIEDEVWNRDCLSFATPTGTNWSSPR